MNRKWKEKVLGNEALVLVGVSRTFGTPLKKTVEELAAEASERDETDIDDWTLLRLADWHCDFRWKLDGLPQ
jgi:hypothetical protein